MKRRRPGGGRPFMWAALTTTVLLGLVLATPVSQAQSDRTTAPYQRAVYAAGTGVLSLRFDDGVPQDHSFVFPLLRERGLRAGFAVPARRLGAPGATQRFLAIQAAGNEIMSHSLTHQPFPEDPAGLIREVVDSKRLLEDEGFKVAAFVAPGPWRAATRGPGFLHTAADRLLRETYAAYDGYVYRALMALPVAEEYRYGRGHRAVDHARLGRLKHLVDDICDRGAGVEILFHARGIGKPGHLSRRGFARFLDYVQLRVQLGDLTVLTPTEQVYATPVSGRARLTPPASRSTRLEHLLSPRDHAGRSPLSGRDGGPE